MTTEYTLRVTIIVPGAMIDDANSYAAVLAFGPPDLHTFGAATWQDASGNLYSVASTLARAAFQADAVSTLERPEWDVEPYQVNMAGAERAQDALYIYGQHGTGQAQPGRIWALVEPAPGNAMAAVDLAGVSRVPVPDPG